MFRSSVAAIAALTLSGAAFAQTDLSSNVHPTPGTPTFVGTYHVATGKFIPAQPGEEGIGSGDEIYNNTALSGFYFDSAAAGIGTIDEGVIPDGTLVAGGQSEYVLNRVLVGYCTQDPSITLQMQLWDAYLPCDDFTGAGGSPPSTTTINASGLPGSATGGLACSVVALDLTGLGVCVQGTDASTSLNFGYSYEFPGAASPTGALLASDPNFCPPGDGTFYQNSMVGCDGSGSGSGLGDLDLMYADGSGCIFFGGYPAAPFASNYLAVGSDLGVQCGSVCPDNNDCACADPISGTGVFNFDNSTATTDGAPDPLCYDFGTSDLTNDVWFSWTPDEDCDYTISTCNQTSIDTKIAIYDGNDCATSSMIDCNDDATSGLCGLTSEVFANGLLAGNTYLIRIGNFPGAVGGTGTFTITSSNCTPTCSTNDDCACATVITDGVYNGTLVGATNDGTASCGASSSSPDRWYSYMASCTGVVTASTCGTHDLPGLDMGIDTVISVYDGCGGTQLACDDDDNPQIACAGLDLGVLRDSAVQVPVVAGQQLLIRVSNFNNGATGPFILRVSCQGASGNDNCADRMPISGTGVFDFDNSAATQDGAGDPLCYDFGTSDIDSDVWFTWTAPCNGDYTVSMCNLTSIDTKIAIYDGPDCGSSSVLDCNDDTCSLQSEVTGTGLVGGNSYLIRIGTFPGAAGGVGQFSIAGPDVGGTNYCVGATNGDGQNGAISISGSTSVAANDLVLVASNLTDSSFAGLFVMGDTPAQVAFGNGFLCVDLAGTFIRLNPIINGGGDVISRAVDNTVSPSDVITAGSTWYFQYWYRDLPVFGTNFTDGICVCFAP